MKPVDHSDGISAVVVESWEWVKQAIAELASKEPESVPEKLEKIVETVRIERPDLLGRSLPAVPVAHTAMTQL